MKNVTAQYTMNGQSYMEKTVWKPVEDEDPKGVILAGETGKWQLMTVTDPARDLAGMFVPGPESEPKMVPDENGNNVMTNIPTSVTCDMAYWDYFNLPLKPGVILA